MIEQISPTGISPQLEEQALKLRQDHEDRSWQLHFASEVNESSQQGIENTIKEAQRISDTSDDFGSLDDLRESPAIVSAQSSLNKAVRDAQDAYDTNIEESRKHVAENLGAYIAMAAIEASEQGVGLKLSTPAQSNTVIHGAEDFSVSPAAEVIPESERIAITKEDLKFPREFDEGEAIISLICNVKDIRTETDGEIGTLYPEQSAEFRGSIREKVEELYRPLTQEERDKIDVVVIAGDTPLVTPGENGLLVDQRRAVLTGKEIIQAVRESMEANGVNPNDHITADGDSPIAVSHLRDVNMLHQTDKPNVRQFMDYMIGKYGAGRELWMAYEEDTERELRESLGVEGPSEIAERMSQLVNLCGYIANIHQQRDPSRRVVVFAVGHYDNISPWAKRALMGIDPAKGFIPVEKGSGIVIKRGKDGSATTHIGGKEYPIEIES